MPRMATRCPSSCAISSCAAFQFITLMNLRTVARLEGSRARLEMVKISRARAPMPPERASPSLPFFATRNPPAFCPCIYLPYLPALSRNARRISFVRHLSAIRAHSMPHARCSLRLRTAHASGDKPHTEQGQSDMRRARAGDTLSTRMGVLIATVAEAQSARGLADADTLGDVGADRLPQ